MRPSSSDIIPSAINPWWIAVTVSLTTFMEVLDISIANVALRHIAGDFGASDDQATWILTSYMVSNAIVLPISGWLANRFGRRRFYLACVALFSLSSFLCGLAPNLSLLIFFRILQGIGGGGLQPSSQAILTDSFPPKLHGAAFAVYGLTTVMAPAIGPTVGGWITDTFSWRWIFLINVPVGLVSMYFTSRLVFDPKSFTQQRQESLRQGFRVDWVGFALLSLGFGCLQIVLDRGQLDDWFASYSIRVMAMLSATALLILPFWEYRQRAPMIDVRLLFERNFLISNMLMFFLGFILFGSTVMLPVMVQSLFGYSPTQAGLVLSPGATTVALVLPAVAFLINRVDIRHMIAFGLLMNAAALMLMSSTSLATDYTTFASDRIIQGFGLAFLFVPINTMAFAQIATGKSSNASAIINLSRNLGGSFGISLVQTWLTQDTQRHRAVLVGHLTQDSATTQTTLNQLRGLLGGMGEHAYVQARAYLSTMVDQHAEFLAFMDNFRLLAVLALMMIPAVYFMRRLSNQQQPSLHE